MRTIHQAAAAMASGETTSVELTKAAFGSISRLNARLNAFLAIMEEDAMARARQMDEERARGTVRSPLHGVPIAVKDVFCTKGVRTTCGSALFADHVPNYDAAVVEKLNQAGAVIVGKTHMHELAYGVTSNNPHFGPVRNPWNVSHIPGGSSGGSGAAVVADMVYMAMGSDTGGSIRMPASFCGCVGIKPTTGRVSRYGVMPLDFTLDHMGPLTRTVRDAAICLQVLAGHDPRDESSSKAAVGQYVPPNATVAIKDLRIGIPENFYYDRLDSAVAAALAALQNTAATLGARLVPVRVPDMEEVNATARLILMSEASAALSPYLGDRTKFGADVMALFDQGRLIAATDYVNAQRLRRLFQADYNKVWEHCDVLLTATTPNPAPRIGQTDVELGGVTEDVRLASTRLVRGINLLGLPALSIPCGFTPDQLPIGAQLIGRAFDEATLFWLGAALEDATDFSRQSPQL